MSMQTSFWPGVKKVICLFFAISIRIFIMILRSEFATNTGESLFAIIVVSFAAKTVARSVS